MTYMYIMSLSRYYSFIILFFFTFYYLIITRQLLCREFHIVKAIFDSLTGKPGDDASELSIASAMIDIFNWNSQVVPLLQYAIHTEVQKTSAYTNILSHKIHDTPANSKPAEQESLLFRHDSFANRLLSEFSTRVGSDFVQRSLRFLMKEILEKDYDVEVHIPVFFFLLIILTIVLHQQQIRLTRPKLKIRRNSTKTESGFWM